jgi:hypothetical protein
MVFNKKNKLMLKYLKKGINFNKNNVDIFRNQITFASQVNPRPKKLLLACRTQKFVELLKGLQNQYA